MKCTYINSYLFGCDGGRCCLVLCCLTHAARSSWSCLCDDSEIRNSFLLPPSPPPHSVKFLNLNFSHFTARPIAYDCRDATCLIWFAFCQNVGCIAAAFQAVECRRLLAKTSWGGWLMPANFNFDLSRCKDWYRSSVTYSFGEWTNWFRN